MSHHVNVAPLRTARQVVACFLLFWAAVATGCTSSTLQAETATLEIGPIESMNELFRPQYNETRTWHWEHDRPLILVHFRSLWLFMADGTKVEEEYLPTPSLYDSYKSFAHLPFLLFLILAPAIDKPTLGNADVKLVELQKRLHAAQSAIDAEFPQARRQDQVDIAQATDGFVTTCLSQQHVTAADFATYSTVVGPIMLRNAEAASEVLLDGLHAIVKRWRNGVISDSEWRQMYVVILGFKMAREGYAQQQYFDAALGSNEIGNRLIYAEGMKASDKGLEVLGSVITDRRAAGLFFADERRMDRDILTDGATAWLAAHKGDVDALRP